MGTIGVVVNRRTGGNTIIKDSLSVRGKARCRLIEGCRLCNISAVGSVRPHDKQVPVSLFTLSAVHKPSLSMYFLGQLGHSRVIVPSLAGLPVITCRLETKGQSDQ